MVSPSRLLDLFHIDLCRTLRDPYLEGKKYMLGIMDDYSRYTWTSFLRSKNEKFQVFIVFAKQVKVIISSRIVNI